MVSFDPEDNAAFKYQTFSDIYITQTDAFFSQRNHNINMPPSASKAGLFSIAILLLLALTNSQSVTIRNFGCKTYNEKQVCTECSTRYYLDSKAICQPVNPNCKTYDPLTGACLSCYPGFGIIETTCLPGIVSNQFDPNCNQFNGSICLKCSSGYYLASSGICSAVDPSCKTHNPDNGFCTSCYAGYAVNGTRCVVSQSAPTVANCNSIDPLTGLCLKCSFGYYFDSNGACIQQSPNCKTFDKTSLTCIECFPGYALSSGNQCVKSDAPSGDPNCKTFNNGFCVECAKGAIFNQNKICIIIDPSCLTFNEQDGSCTSCYPGYELSGVTCKLSNVTATGDPFCKRFLANNVCAECSTRYFINSFGICQEVNPLCNQYDGTNGNCLSCYPGFNLVSFSCLKGESQITDQYCKTWNGTVCIQCSKGAFFLPNGTCQPVDPLCKTFNSLNGDCTSCFDSFALQGGKCVNSTQPLSDPNCASFFGSVCLQCSKGYIFLDNGLCGIVNPNCRNYSIVTGECTSCYMGYVLSSGQCINSTTDVAAIDPNCAEFQNNLCVKCSKNFYFSNSLCTAVDPLCNGYDPSNGACMGCFQSYVLTGTKCVQDKNNSLSDPNCASWLQGICISCASRTFMNSSGLCQNVDINCNTYTPRDGRCTSCYPGFELTQGRCVEAVSPSSCNKFNPDGTCAVCGQGSYLSQGTCIRIDPQCANFSSNTQSCLGCYPGYSLLNGVCQVSEVDSQYQVANCYAYDSVNQCIKCYDRFYLDGNECKTVSVFCKTYDDLAGNCLTCYSTFTLTNGQCKQ